VSTALVTIEGVLTTSREFAVNALPQQEGIRLLNALTQNYRVVLSTAHESSEQVIHWLRSNGVSPDAYATMVVAHEDPVRTLRASRTAVGLVVSAEPQEVVAAASVGVPGLLFVPPRPAAGRVDLSARPIRDWSEIEAEIEEHHRMRSNRP
jgi:hypothetical protein